MPGHGGAIVVAEHLSDPCDDVRRNAIAAQPEKVRDAVVRLNISLPAPLENQFSDAAIQEALEGAYYYTVAQDVQRETRLRMGNRTAEEIAPLNALKAYLDSKNIPAERKKVLLEYGQKFIEGFDES